MVDICDAEKSLCVDSQTSFMKDKTKNKKSIQINDPFYKGEYLGSFIRIKSKKGKSFQISKNDEKERQEEKGELNSRWIKESMNSKIEIIETTTKNDKPKPKNQNEVIFFHGKGKIIEKRDIKEEKNGTGRRKIFQETIITEGIFKYHKLNGKGRQKMFRSLKTKKEPNKLIKEFIGEFRNGLFHGKSGALIYYHHTKLPINFDGAIPKEEYFDQLKNELTKEIKIGSTIYVIPKFAIIEFLGKWENGNFGDFGEQSVYDSITKRNEISEFKGTFKQVSIRNTPFFIKYDGIITTKSEDPIIKHPSFKFNKEASEKKGIPIYKGFEINEREKRFSYGYFDQFGLLNGKGKSHFYSLNERFGGKFRNGEMEKGKYVYGDQFFEKGLFSENGENVSILHGKIYDRKGNKLEEGEFRNNEIFNGLKRNNSSEDFQVITKGKITGKKRKRRKSDFP